ncbi:MAG: matrixin family metalloprotease [Myxococcales bacterium]|nr:matrixin family metalloprotease [Myxococcales bacterium]
MKPPLSLGRPGRPHRFPPAAVAVVLGMLLWSTPASAWCRLTTTGGQGLQPDKNGCPVGGIPLSWDRRCIAYSLYAGGARDVSPGDLERAIADSFNAWEQVTCMGEQVEIRIAESEEPSRCNRALFDLEGGNVNTIMFVEDWKARDHDPAAFALTTVWHDKSTGQILDADMEVNENRGTYGNCPALGSCSLIDVRNVITHEAGHFFGLAHSLEIDSTMFANAPNGEIKKRDLTEDDREGFCDAYPTGSLPKTCDYAPIGGFDPTCADDTSGCGCRIAGLPQRTPRLPLLLGAAALALVLLRRRRPRR